MAPCHGRAVLNSYLRWLTVGALIIRIGFWGLLIITVTEYTPKPILITKAPYIETYYRSPIDPFKGPL